MDFLEKITIFEIASTSSKRVTLVPIFFEKISHTLHCSSSSAKNPGCAPKEKNFRSFLARFFLFACHPLFRGYCGAYFQFEISSTSLDCFISQLASWQLHCLKRLSGNFCSVFYPFLQKVILAVPAHLFACRSRRLYAVLLLFADSTSTVRFVAILALNLGPFLYVARSFATVIPLVFNVIKRCTISSIKKRRKCAAK